MRHRGLACVYCIVLAWLWVPRIGAAAPPRPAAEPAPRASEPSRGASAAPSTRDGSGLASAGGHPASGGAPPRIGPFGVSSKDGKSSLSVGFAGQLQLDYENRDEGPGVARDQALRPLLRRIRLLLQGKFLSRSLRYYLQLSTAPGSLEIMDYYLDWKLAPFVGVRLGQMKTPFTRYRSGSFKDLTFVDWSILSPAFGAERQLGFTFHDAGTALPWLVWDLGLFTGVNARNAHALAVADTFGEQVPNPSDLTGPAPVSSIHPEILVRLGYRLGAIDLSTDSDWRGGPLRLYAGASTSWDLDADPIREHGLRASAEVLAKLYRVSFYAVTYLAWARKEDGGRVDLSWGQWGMLAQASLLLARRYELSARYAWVGTSRYLLAEARWRADAIIAAAAPQDRPALEERYESAGLVLHQHEVSVGFNVYLVGRSLKAQLDASWLGQDRLRSSGDGSRLRNHARGRLQLQLVF